MIGVVQAAVYARVSSERRAREEVERIKAEETAEEERKQARLRELAEQARERREAEVAEDRRRKEERGARLRRSQEENAEGEERLARDLARRQWKASGGTEAAFEQAWPSMWQEMLKRRTVDADGGRVKRWPEAVSAAFRERSRSNLELTNNRLAFRFRLSSGGQVRLEVEYR